MTSYKDFEGFYLLFPVYYLLPFHRKDAETAKEFSCFFCTYRLQITCHCEKAYILTNEAIPLPFLVNGLPSAVCGH